MELRAPGQQDTDNFLVFSTTDHCEFRAVTDITTEEAGVHHAKMVCNAVVEPQEVLLQGPPNKVPTGNPFHKQLA